jgi:hypothetical protein
MHAWLCRIFGIDLAAVTLTKAASLSDPVLTLLWPCMHVHRTGKKGTEKLKIQEHTLHGAQGRRGYILL